MKYLSSNRKIINILESLKDKEPNYPPELMQSRREMFSRQALSAALTVNTANNELDTGNHTPPSIGTLMETLLIIVIAFEQEMPPMHTAANLLTSGIRYFRNVLSM